MVPIAQRSIIGFMEEGGKKDWRSEALRQIADHIERTRSHDPEGPRYFDVTWTDGTRLNVEVEPPEPRHALTAEERR